MADRTVRVILQAVTQQFDAAMQKAAGSAKALQSNMEKAHEVGDFKALQGPLVAYGAAMTAVGAAVAKTGIEYNTLQQTSRAALTTLLGGAQQANAQMGKLDDFARTSPFGKDIFIRAQQQMLAFGVETEKVIPYLDALNDATAAAGGNGQQLGELAYIMAQISAAGKITAQDLMQFGQRGVNAAELIGDSMGKTGAQIRDEITAGTLDADQALDALAQGMSEKFEGASANVKDTMEGAFDRVKAAWRDLSASIMEPAVGQSGGGFLVDLTNSVADFLRAVEKLPDPVKQAGAALGGISGAAALAAGSLIVAVPKIVEVNAAWKTLGTTLPGVARVLSSLGPATLAAGAVIAAIGTFIRPTLEWHARAREVVEEYSTALAENTDLLADNAAATDESIRQIVAKRLQEEGLLDIASELGASLSDVTSAVLGEADALERVQGAAQAHVDGIEALIAAKRAEQDVLAAGGVMTEEQAIKYSDLGNEIEELGRKASDATGLQGQLLAAVGDEESRFQKGVEGARELQTAEEQLAEAAASAIDPTQQLADAVGATGEASSNAASGTRDFAAEAEAAAEAAAQLSREVSESLDTLNDYYAAAVAASDATIGVEAAFQKAADAAKKNGESLDLTTEKGRENMAALNGIVGAAERQAEAMLAAGDETEDIVAATQRARDEFVKAATAMTGSSDEAEKLADRYGLIPELVLTRIQQPGMELSQEEAQVYREMLANLPPEVRTHILTIPDLSGYWDVNNALNSINGRTVTTYVAMKKYGQGALAAGGRVGDAVAAYQGMSDGGRVYGPGTTTSDEAALIALSHGEFVIREWAARSIGYDQLERANNTGSLPTEHRMQATPAAYTVNYAVPQGQQAAPQVTNHYTLQMPSASLRDVATVAEFFEHPELHAHHAGGTR